MVCECERWPPRQMNGTRNRGRKIMLSPTLFQPSIMMQCRLLFLAVGGADKIILLRSAAAVAVIVTYCHRRPK